MNSNEGKIAAAAKRFVNFITRKDSYTSNIGILILDANSIELNNLVLDAFNKIASKMLISVRETMKITDNSSPIIIVMNKKENFPLAQLKEIDGTFRSSSFEERL